MIRVFCFEGRVELGIDDGQHVFLVFVGVRLVDEKSNPFEVLG